VSEKTSNLSTLLKKEAAVFLILLLIGLVLLPICIWFVGNAVFGAYDGAGYSDFFGTLSGKIRSGNPVAWFLVLSPWIVWQCLRLIAFGWRSAGEM
jgi:hypothetical protein